MEKSKLNSLIKRVISALVLAPLVLGGLLSGWYSFALLVMFISALLAWEWANMVENKNNTVYGMAYFMAAACAISFANIYYSLAVMVLTMVFVFFKAKEEQHRYLLMFGVPYIVLGIASFVWMYVIFGDITTLWFVLSVWAVDIGGYVVGCTVKGPKLAPKISPNKTWSGLFGAMLFSALMSVAVSWYFNRGFYEVFAVLGVILAIISQMGDLLESKIKRYLGVKDSSNLIPGHGGIFDRIDGLLFAAPFMLIIFLFFVF